MAETDRRPKRIATYVNRQSRSLTVRQKQLLADVLPTVEIPAEGAIDPDQLFGRPPTAVWLEVGFGGGEHLIAQAVKHPHIGFIAAEPFLDGVTKALAGIDANALSNVCLFRGDARDLFDRLPDDSINRAFVLFPDPWPKRRHHKRRLIQPEFLDDLARLMPGGGKLRVATDVESYVEHALFHLMRHRRFVWTVTKADDWRTPPPDHVTTRYEQKQLGDIAPVWLDFARV